MACDLDVQIRSIKVHRPLQNSRISLCGTSSVVLSPPMSPLIHRQGALQDANKVLRVSCLSAYHVRPNPILLTSPSLSPRVAGPEQTFFCREPSNLARGSDEDCLIRRTKFEILPAHERSFQGPSSKKKQTPISLW